MENLNRLDLLRTVSVTGHLVAMQIVKQYP